MLWSKNYAKIQTIDGMQWNTRHYFHPIIGIQGIFIYALVRSNRVYNCSNSPHFIELYDCVMIILLIKIWSFIRYIWCLLLHIWCFLRYRKCYSNLFDAFCILIILRYDIWCFCHHISRFCRNFWWFWHNSWCLNQHARWFPLYTRFFLPLVEEFTLHVVLRLSGGG